jgi:hypothetical protein
LATVVLVVLVVVVGFRGAVVVVVVGRAVVVVVCGTVVLVVVVGTSAAGDPPTADVAGGEDAHAPCEPTIPAMTPAAPSTAAARHGERELNINRVRFDAESTPASPRASRPTLASGQPAMNAGGGHHYRPSIRS